MNMKQKMSVVLISIILLSATALAASTSDTTVKAPTATFSAKPLTGNVPLKVVFTDKSTGKPTSWKWTFGDGSSSTTKNPTHTYSKTGKYTVTLTVKNKSGSNTATKSNYINVVTVKPVASFSASPTSGEAPLTVKFTDKSTGTPTSWSWNFGDKSTSTAQNPTHKYGKAGKYTVSLTVKNAKGSNTKTMSGYINVKVTPPPVDPEMITVSADASLKEAFKDMESKFEAEHPEIYVNLNFGGSGDLRRQIEGGAPVDVFASGDENQMDILADESLITNNSRKNFAHNSLVLIVPKSSTLNITSIKDLTNYKVQKIGIGNPDIDSAGKYTRLALTEAGLWSQLENKLVLTENVKQVLTYVERGDVDAGFVYITDAKTAEPGNIKIVTNVSVSTPITYPIAVVSSTEYKEQAQKFLDFVTGKEGQAILKKYGFITKS